MIGLIIYSHTVRLPIRMSTVAVMPAMIGSALVSSPRSDYGILLLQQKENAVVQQNVRQAVDEGTPVARRHGSVEDAADQWHRAVVRRHDAARGGRLVAHLENLRSITVWPLPTPAPNVP